MRATQHGPQVEGLRPNHFLFGRAATEHRSSVDPRVTKAVVSKSIEWSLDLSRKWKGHTLQLKSLLGTTILVASNKFGFLLRPSTQEVSDRRPKLMFRAISLLGGVPC